MSTANQTTTRTHHHAHHYQSVAHEYDTSKQGVWLFLVTEILMFGGLFVGYAYYHHIFPDIFKIGSTFTDWRLGAANTVVLLFSSLTMALAIYFTQTNERQKARWMLLITILCGAGFMIIKYFEYSHKIHLGLMPGAWYNADPQVVLEHVRQTYPTLTELPENLPLYFSFYYMMTGLHGIHVMIGMSLIFWIWLRFGRGWYGAGHFTGVEGVGLFWHLIDLIWIYLFPLLYLVV